MDAEEACELSVHKEGVIMSTRREYQTEWMRRKRKGRVSRELPPILVDPIKRDKVYRICQAFAKSHHPEYSKTVWVGEYCLSSYMCMFNLA